MQKAIAIAGVHEALTTNEAVRTPTARKITAPLLLVPPQLFVEIVLGV